MASIRHGKKSAAFLPGAASDLPGEGDTAGASVIQGGCVKQRNRWREAPAQPPLRSKDADAAIKAIAKEKRK